MASTLPRPTPDACPPPTVLTSGDLIGLTVRQPRVSSICSEYLTWISFLSLLISVPSSHRRLIVQLASETGLLSSAAIIIIGGLILVSVFCPIAADNVHRWLGVMRHPSVRTNACLRLLLLRSEASPPECGRFTEGALYRQDPRGHLHGESFSADAEQIATRC